MADKNFDYITLYNRYNEKVGLRKTPSDDKVYTFEGSYDYMRIIYEDSTNTLINAIDPSGGPFIQVGNFYLNDNLLVLDSIVFDNTLNKYKLTFKANEEG